MARGSVTRYTTEIEPTWLANVPLLNLVEKLRLAVLRFIWKYYDIEEITGDNAVKAGVLGGLLLVVLASTVGNILFRLFVGVGLSASISKILVFALLGYFLIYFTDPSLGKFVAPRAVYGPTPLIAGISAVVFTVLLAPILGPISTYFAGGPSQVSSMLGILLTASALTAKSATAGAVTLVLPPILGSVLTVYAIYGLGAMVNWLITEIKSLTTKGA